MVEGLIDGTQDFESSETTIMVEILLHTCQNPQNIHRVSDAST
jgi:hypothetical protein